VRGSIARDGQLDEVVLPRRPDHGSTGVHRVVELNGAPGERHGRDGGREERPLLSVEGVSKDFGGLRAVNYCDLHVQRGTITALIGPNGAGKTTLFGLITGFHRPDSGRVYLDGEDITGLPPHQVFRRGLSRTFQIPREHKSMTVLENLMLVPPNQLGERFWNPILRPRAVRRQEREVREKALEVLDFLTLGHLKDEYAGTLSGGQKKLLELARTLMADPKIVLLDEPAAGVNPSLMVKIREKIVELNADRGITFLLIEHDIPLVMGLCNPVIVLNQGSKLAEGPPEVVRSDARVLEAYLGGQHGAADG
jgi:branched-chain amino acid transport system ATP-binding protein